LYNDLLNLHIDLFCCYIKPISLVKNLIYSNRSILKELLMYMLCFHVPQTHLEQVKNAIFAAGAGVIDNYSHCCWQVIGDGQFMPLAGSNAFIGELNQIEMVQEYKVETVCHDHCIQEVIHALKMSHPYETPSYQVWPLTDF
jgi:structural toxin protein (hemagglutinin/hemolysin) RtxA